MMYLIDNEKLILILFNLVINVKIREIDISLVKIK